MCFVVQEDCFQRPLECYTRVDSHDVLLVAGILSVSLSDSPNVLSERNIFLDSQPLCIDFITLSNSRACLQEALQNTLHLLYWITPLSKVIRYYQKCPNS